AAAGDAHRPDPTPRPAELWRNYSPRLQRSASADAPRRRRRRVSARTEELLQLPGPRPPPKGGFHAALLHLPPGARALLRSGTNAARRTSGFRLRVDTPRDRVGGGTDRGGRWDNSPGGGTHEPRTIDGPASGERPHPSRAVRAQQPAPLPDRRA